MTSAVAIWSQLVEANKIVQLEVPHDILITQAVFDEKLVDEKRTTIKVHVYPQEDDEEDEEDEEAATEDQKETLVLAHLLPGRIETQALNLILNEGSRVEFEVTGKNSVYLVGNFIMQPPPSFDDSDDEDGSDFDDEEDMEAFNNMTEEEKEKLIASLMREQGEGSDEEMASPKASKKRPAEIEAATPDSKAANKKLKAADGKAAPSPKVDASEKKGKKAEKKEKAKATTGEEKVEKKDKAEAKPAKSGKTFTTTGGIVVEDKVVGTGKMAKKGKHLKMRYILKLANGKIVDKNTSGAPFKFRLGAGEVIKGWDEGLVGMQVGGERKLEVPPAMGYGKRKMADIPANSTLYFEVKLLDTDA